MSGRNVTDHSVAHLWVTIIGVVIAVVGIFVAAYTQLYPEQAKALVDRFTGDAHGDAHSVSLPPGLEPSAELPVPTEPVNRIDLAEGGLGPDLRDALDRTIAEGHAIETVAFTERYWVLVFDRNHLLSSPTLPSGLLDSLEGLRRSGRHIRQVLFTPWNGGWAVLYDRNRYASYLGPPGLDLAFREAQQRGLPVSWIGISHLGGWVLSRGEYGNLPGGPLPPPLEVEVRAGTPGSLVSFTPEGGHVFLDREQIRSSQAIPPRVRDQLTELLHRGAQIRLATFASRDRWLILWEERGVRSAHR